MKNALSLAVLLLIFSAGYAVAQPPKKQTVDVSANENIQNKTLYGNIEVQNKEDKTSLGKALSSLILSVVKRNAKGEIEQFVLDKGRTITDDYSAMLTFPDLHESYIVNYIYEQKKYPKFNMKKDDINQFVLRKAKDGWDYSLAVKNRKGKIVLMSDFLIGSVSSNVLVTGEISDGSLTAKFHGKSTDYLTGKIPTKGSLHLQLSKSSVATDVPYQITFPNEIGWYGTNGVFVVEKASEFKGQYCRVTELLSARSWYARYPLTINASGKNGSNGRNGYSGANGINSYSYKDKNGNYHTINGTCGSRGGNGGDGEDGDDGGNIIVYLDNTMLKTDVTLLSNGGKGGSGGRGGSGGVHGAGSGCYGVAASGANGRNGKDGKKGEYHLIPIDAAPIKDLHKRVTVYTHEPSISLYRTVKKK
ncbi:MAG: hypothetical protein IJS00_05295 [Paludibacteraceae bacterium]|nr:hypothetical protein [Paludibacteraceae bacterium]